MRGKKEGEKRRKERVALMVYYLNTCARRREEI